MPIKGLEPGKRAALVISECQNAIVSEAFTQSTLSGQVAARGILPRIATLADAFRARGLPVAHCLITLPRNMDAWNVNCFLAHRLAREMKLVEGSEGAKVVAEIPIREGDIVSERHHGMSPFTGTMLNADLRRHRIDTVVLAGVSTNIALQGAATEAVGLGYHVVLAEDCSAGGTADSHASQLALHLPLLATISDGSSIMREIAAQ